MELKDILFFSLFIGLVNGSILSTIIWKIFNTDVAKTFSIVNTVFFTIVFVTLLFTDYEKSNYYKKYKDSLMGD